MRSSNATSSLLRELCSLAKPSALRPGLEVFGGLCLRYHILLLLSKNGLAPLVASYRALSNSLLQDLNPCSLISCIVGIEVDCLAVGESDSETFLDELVTLVFLCESRLATTLARLAPFGIANKRSAVIDEFRSLSKVNLCSRLTCRFVVSCQLGSNKTEETTSPELVYC